MLAAAALIEARLKSLPALAGWDVRNELNERDRRALPSASIACIGSSANPKDRAAVLEPRWQITLSVRTGAQAADQLDNAIEAVIGSLQGWMPPPDTNGRRWDRFALHSVLPPETQEQGVISFVITFTTASLYRGQE